MTKRGFVPARRHRDIRAFTRSLVSAGLALWLMLGAVGAQHRSAGVFSEHIVPGHKGDPQAQGRINEAFGLFEELLAVSKSAAAPNSHWQVQLASWNNAQQAWEGVSATLPTSVQDLKRCALTLLRARALIEHADGLFLRAREISDPTRAVELLDEHEKFQKQARDLSEQAEECYRDARYSYLKRGGELFLNTSLTFGQERPALLMNVGVQGRIRSVQEACRVLREAANLNQLALRSPKLTELESWETVGKRLDALFDYEPESRFHLYLMKHCHCPVMTARKHLERLRQLDLMSENPRATDPRSRQNVERAIQEEKTQIQWQIERTEECYRKVCNPSPSITPSIEECEDATPARAYAYGFVKGIAYCLGNASYGVVMALARDLSDFDLMAEALHRGDSATAGRLLDIKKERDVRSFDTFVKSLNPNVINVSPVVSGFRQGARLCQFGIIPGIVKASRGTPLTLTGRVLPQSRIVVQRVQLSGASALKPRNAKDGVGLAFERWRLGNLPANFKTIDRVPPQELASAVEKNGGVVTPSEIVSIKTIEATPTSLTYAPPGKIFSKLEKDYLPKLQKYPTYCLRGITVTAGPNTRRVLEVGIPESATARQLAEIDRAAMVARQMGIEMRVYQLSGVEGW